MTTFRYLFESAGGIVVPLNLIVELLVLFLVVCHTIFLNWEVIHFLGHINS